MMRALVMVFVLSACGTVDVVVAETPEQGRPELRNRPCVIGVDGGSSECVEGEFCEKRSCSDAAGRCVRKPVACDESLGAVCGCNGVTYWNDCLRKASGVAAAVQGECSLEGECRNRSECADGAAVCGRLNSCNGPGTCWVLPTTCPSTSGQPWMPCGPPPMRPIQCKGLCEALRLELPQRPAMTNMCL